MFSRLLDQIQALYQYPLPHHWLSRLMYKVIRIRHITVKNWQIHTAIRHFNIDMSLALEPDPKAYTHFNDFFTRQLKPGVRPITSGANEIASPVDGKVSQAGNVTNGRIFQAKGHDYSLLELLGGTKHLESEFDGGNFTTIYLSPRDYHRIHMPLTGTLRETIYIPGRLFSVNPATTRTVPKLFARNERLVAIFDTEFGPMAVILVAAIFVAGIETIWSGNYGDEIFRSHQYRDLKRVPAQEQIKLERGAEMGRFNMGSTVILLFARNRSQWLPELAPDKITQMGGKIGHSIA